MAESTRTHSGGGAAVALFAAVSRTFISRASRAALLVALIALAPSGALAQADAACEDALDRADTAYVEGRFDEAISLLSPCTEGAQVDRALRVRGYRLLALALLRSDRIADARATILSLLSVAPDYRPDPVNDPPAYSALVGIVRQEVQPESDDPLERVETAVEEEPSWFREHLGWLVAGGAVVTAGVLGAVLVGGEQEGGQPLPGPPGMPN